MALSVMHIIAEWLESKALNFQYQSSRGDTTIALHIDAIVFTPELEKHISCQTHNFRTNDCTRNRTCLLNFL